MKKKFWTKEEIDYLIENYPDKENHEPLNNNRT